MKAKNIKIVMTVTLATTMVLGSAMTAFADAGESEGTGTYEGGEMQYPTLSVTLPTIPDNTYDYIADPNGLISATSAAHYGGATFTGDSGIFFKTSDGDAEADPVEKPMYTNKSKALSVTNENAQDVDITIKLEQKTAGDEGIEYSDVGTFEDTDTANKIYLAVTDGAASDPAISALGATAATLTTTVAGVPNNYKPSWDSDNGYGYVLKDAGLTDWGVCSYNLIGALNKKATWGDEVTFPEIKVTWSYAEHQENAAPSIATRTYNVASPATALEVPVDLGHGDLAATGITEITATDTNGSISTVPTTRYSFADGKLTFSDVYIGGLISNNRTGRVHHIKFNDAAATVVDVTINVQ